MAEAVRERALALFAAVAARFGARPFSARARFLAHAAAPCAHELVHAAHQRLLMATAVSGRKATGPEAAFLPDDDPGDAQFTEGSDLPVFVFVFRCFAHSSTQRIAHARMRARHHGDR